MKKKSLIIVIIFLFAFLTVGSSTVQAQDNFFSRFRFSRDRDDRGRDDRRDSDKKRKKHGRSPHFNDTIIAGTIFDGANNPVNGDQDFEKVTVTCNGVVKIGDIGSDGKYSVSFKKNQCDEGDAVTTSAVTEQGSGSSSTTVYNDEDEGPCGDNDVTVLDVSVPEFGLVGGAFTALASVVGYLKLRKVV